MFASLLGLARNCDTHAPPNTGFIAVFEQHVQWKQQFEAALRSGGAGYAERAVAEGEGSALAAWLARMAASPLAADPALHELRNAFFRFQAAAAEALGLAQGGDAAAAQRCITRGDYPDGSQRIKRLLVELERRRLADRTVRHSLASV